MNTSFLSILLIGLTLGSVSSARETLPPLVNGTAPKTFNALWAGFDPRAEPLDVEVLQEWEEDGVVMKVLRYRIGVFKGKKAMMAAVYGFPKGGKKLPGLVQIHGGGQYAHSNAVFTNAKRGYATLSISWAGRIDAPKYKVNPDGVRLFWEGKTEDPNYKLTTDWGSLDAYHAPTRSGLSSFGNTKPSEWTLDAVESPRNNQWFLCTIGARRALTFLERQPEVNAELLGVYGHSMGGKLTVLTAGSDSRVKAAAPSCGGVSDRQMDNLLSDDVYLKNISCPIMFLSPANDFHGRINDLQTAVTEIKSEAWRMTCAAHHNHQDTAVYEVATQIWFDQYLKGTFVCPQTPQTELRLSDGIPVFTVRPDPSKNIRSVDIYYTQQGQVDGLKDNRENTKARFWHRATPVEKGQALAAELPIHSLDKPLWVFANVVYALDQPITGAGYYYGTYTTDQFNLSSLMAMVMPEELQAAGVKATLKPTPLIETFEGEWKKDWFTYRPEEWPLKSHKLYDPIWAAPAGAKLTLDVRSASANKLVIGIDQYATEVDLPGGEGWQSISLSHSDFIDAAGNGRTDWNGVMELRLGDKETLKDKKKGGKLDFGRPWQGTSPEFRNLRWTVK